MEKILLARVTEVASAPAAAIWAILTDFGNPQRLAPVIDRCSVTGAGVGAVRIVESSRGLCIHERLVECDPGAFRFGYEVLDSGDMPFAGVQSYRATVVLEPRDALSVHVTWSSEGRLAGPPEPVTAYLEALYRRAIGNLAAQASAESSQ